ncbi:MAG: tRNA lysidine(34) synthetase TilS [bacterium]|nr:tRNA lysidine(34) synthetase TilS [bacterium]
MEKVIENFLKEKNLLDKSNTFVIAFSGGFDSMAMAHALISLSKTYNFKIVLAHLNHNWRGKKSLKEAQNCEKFASKNNVVFYTETLSDDIPHTETAAREARYKFFERAAAKFNTDKIFTAHTKSDNIETVLQRIIKGTGISGLCGIQDERQVGTATVYRPILSCTREDVLNYCNANKLKPNDDNSNKDTKYFRNKIRNKLLPKLKKNYDENIENAIARLIKNAKDSEELLKDFSKEALSNVFEDEDILTKEFMKLSIPMKKRVIKELLENNNFDYDQKRIADTLEFIERTSSSKSGKTFSLGENRWLFVNQNSIELIDENSYNTTFAQAEINMDGETYLKEFDAVIKVTKWKGKAPATFPKDTDTTIFADFSNIELPLVLRPRIFGDKIVPFGKNSPIKLKKYFNNKGLSKHDKSKVLLIASPKEVLWAINLGISNNIRVKTMPTHKVEFYIRSEHE